MFERVLNFYFTFYNSLSSMITFDEEDRNEGLGVPREVSGDGTPFRTVFLNFRTGIQESKSGLS